MSAFVVHLVHELRAGFRDRSQLFMNYLFPLVVFILMASLMSGINPGFRETMIPAMCLFAVMGSALLSLSASWISQREAGIFRSYRINGIPVRDILLAPAAASMAHMALVGLLIAGIGAAAFRAPLPAAFLPFVLGWVATALALVGIGMAIGALMPNPRAGMLVSQLLYLPSIMLGGLMFPAALLPSGLGFLSRLLPSRWGMEAMTAPSLSSPAFLLALGVLLATALVGYLVARRGFEWHATPLRSPVRRLSGLLVLVPAVVGALVV